MYFAKYANISAKYCINNKNVHNGDYCMLACKVIIGEMVQGSKDMKTAPFMENNLTQYDTLVDNINKPCIFVITRDYFALPKYKIWFRKASVVTELH